MIITKARFMGLKFLKTFIKVTFYIPNEFDEMQLEQALKSWGWLAFNLDEFKLKVEQAMREKSVGMDSKGKSKSMVLRGHLFQLWDKTDTTQSWKEFYNEKMDSIINYTEKQYKN